MYVSGDCIYTLPAKQEAGVRVGKLSALAVRPPAQHAPTHPRTHAPTHTGAYIPVEYIYINGLKQAFIGGPLVPRTAGTGPASKLLDRMCGVGSCEVGPCGKWDLCAAEGIEIAWPVTELADKVRLGLDWVFW